MLCCKRKMRAAKAGLSGSNQQAAGASGASCVVGIGAPIQGQIGQNITCPETKVPGYCIVPADKANAICLANPNCKYVGTTTNAGWNAAYPNSKALSGGTLSPNAEWSSAPKVTIGAPIQGQIGQNITCPETKVPGYCIVPADQANAICLANPNCKYVGTTTNAGWNAAYPNLKALSGGTLSPNAEWSSAPKVDASSGLAIGAPIQGQIGQNITCPETTVPGYCIVPADKANAICLANPNCKYVGTTTNAGWNAAYPNSKALSGGTLSPNAEWSSAPKVNC